MFIRNFYNLYYKKDNEYISDTVYVFQKGEIDTMGKQHVIMRRLNWDVEFYKDLLTGNGFQIIEPSGISIDGVKKKSMYGANSPLYGTNYEDEQSFIERYRCSCGEFVGRQFEGEECPSCHQKSLIRSGGCNECTNCGWSKCS
jgi:hypothetical protein